MGFEDEAYGDPFSGLSSSDVGGPTTPAEGQGIGGNFFGGLLDLARQFVPGVNSALNLAGKVGNFIGTISGTRPAPDVSSFGGSDYSAYTGRDIPTPMFTPFIPMSSGFQDPFDPAQQPYIFSGEEASLSTVGPISGMDLAIPMGEGSIPKTLLQWLKRIALAYGPSVASAVWVEYQKRRRSGQSGTLAKAALDAAYPVRGRVSRGRRRRMNPTNVRALRRALRRVRGFKRMTRKVKGLGLWGRRGGKTRVVYRRARRGDLWDVEDAADEFDEAEDLGYEDYAPEFFREEEEDE